MNNIFDAKSVSIIHLDNGFTIDLGEDKINVVVEIRTTETNQYVNTYCRNKSNDLRMCVASMHYFKNDGSLNFQVTSFKGTRWYWVINNPTQEFIDLLVKEISYLRKYKKELISQVKGNTTESNSNSGSTENSQISVILNKINQLYKAGKLMSVRGKNAVNELMTALESE